MLFLCGGEGDRGVAYSLLQYVTEDECRHIVYVAEKIRQVIGKKLDDLRFKNREHGNERKFVRDGKFKQPVGFEGEVVKFRNFTRSKSTLNRFD